LGAVGRYILDPVIFETLLGIARGAGGEIQLTDAIAADAARLPLTAFRFQGQRFDCGCHDGLVEAALARQIEVKRMTAASIAEHSVDNLAVRTLGRPIASKGMSGLVANATAYEGTVQ